MVATFLMLLLTNPGRIGAPLVSLDLANESLSTMCKELKRQTQIDFRVTPALRDRKITAMCSNQPLSSFMAAASETLQLTFEEADGRVDIKQSDAQKAAEREQERVDQAALERAIRSSLRAWTVCATCLEGDMKRLSIGLMPGSKTAMESADYSPSALKRLAADKDFFQVAAACGDPTAIARRLAAGERLVFSGRESDGLPLVDLTLRGREMMNSDREVQRPRFLLWADSGSFRLHLVTTVTLEDGMTFPAISTLDLLAVFPDWFRGAGPVAKALTTYGVELPETVGAAKLDDQYELVSTSLSGLVTLADHARALSKAAGLPVIADGSRMAVSLPWSSSPDTVGDYVRQLAKSELQGRRRIAGGREVGGWLSLHHERWWSLRTREIPESLLQPMEEAFRKGTGPDFTDYCALAGGWDREPPDLDPYRYVAAFPVQPAIQRWAHFKFCSSLSPEQFRAATGEGVWSGTLTPAQRDLMQKALLVSSFLGASALDLFAEAVGRGAAGREILFRLSVSNPDPRAPVFTADTVAGATNPVTLKAGWFARFSFGLDERKEIASAISVPFLAGTP